MIKKYKKDISKKIRQRNKKKKLQCKSANQNSIFDTAYISELVNILTTMDSKVSHNIKFINRISENFELSHDKNLLL